MRSRETMVASLLNTVVFACSSLIAAVSIGATVTGLNSEFLSELSPSRDVASRDLAPRVEYDYRYTIDDISGVSTDRWERRVGDFVRGGYTFLEPDGRIRSVDYETDGSEGGFRAVVRRASPAIHLLSTQLLYKSLELHGDPVVNRLARDPKTALSR